MAKINRRCSRMYERQILQEEYPEDGIEKMKMFENIRKTKTIR